MTKCTRNPPLSSPGPSHPLLIILSPPGGPSVCLVPPWPVDKRSQRDPLKCEIHVVSARSLRRLPSSSEPEPSVIMSHEDPLGSAPAPSVASSPATLPCSLHPWVFLGRPPVCSLPRGLCSACPRPQTRVPLPRWNVDSLRAQVVSVNRGWTPAPRPLPGTQEVLLDEQEGWMDSLSASKAHQVGSHTFNPQGEMRGRRSWIRCLGWRWSEGGSS